MLKNDTDYFEANVYITPPADQNCSDEDSSGDEDQGTVNNFTRHQLEADAEVTVCKGGQRIRIGGRDDSNDDILETSISSEYVVASGSGSPLQVLSGTTPENVLIPSTTESISSTTSVSTKTSETKNVRKSNRPVSVPDVATTPVSTNKSRKRGRLSTSKDSEHQTSAPVIEHNIKSTVPVSNNGKNDKVVRK